MVSKPAEKPSIDEIAVQFLGSVPRFLQALENHRYVILDRDNLPRLAPTQAEVRAAAREIAKQQKTAEQPKLPASARDLLLRKYEQALQRHHDRLHDDECPTCGLPRR